MTLIDGWYKGTRCNRLTPAQLLECFGIPRTPEQARGAEMWLELCRMMARELPETAAQAMRCLERF